MIMFPVEQNAPMSDNLTEALESLAPQHRFHMPGHKGVLPPPFADIARIDMTELPQTGNLYTESDGLIRRAERRGAALYGAARMQFLTGGATQGIFTMLAACTRPGDTVAVDRGCHRSVYAAMALLDLTPWYLPRQTWEPCGICASLDPQIVPEETACVLITDPTYYGVLSPERRWVTAAGREVPLLVDAAHGAHLPLLSGGHSPLRHARMAVCSAHKTLPALGQAAFLLLSEPEDDERVRYLTSVFGTASPSYPILASMDGAFDALERDGRERWAGTEDFAQRLRRQWPGLLREEPDLPIDAVRLCVYTGDGYRDALRLEREYGVLCEMADTNNVVLILTPNDPPESHAALEKGLQVLDPRTPPTSSRRIAPPLPRRVMPLREALFAPVARVRLTAAAGRIAARPLAPYPPGVPLVAPGEGIDKNHIEILLELCYNEGDPRFAIEVVSE